MHNPIESRPRLFIRRVAAVLFAAALFAGIDATAFAQGVQTGTIRGTVQDQQGLPMPGVTITATSPALQGPRSTVSPSNNTTRSSAMWYAVERSWVM